jgi:exonuclease SbcC
VSQLPIINQEILKILHGIVDFSVEFQSDADNNALDIFINYGDSRRLIELGSGMEKMISSLAIRVALYNVSSLPKSDIFIVDEGFGSLDDENIDACLRLLISLKKYFHNTLVISHLDNVKETVDNVLEVVRHEKDSQVMHT